jgi:hypothetical protein
MKWTPSADTTVTGVRVQWGTSPTALTNQFTVAGRTTQIFVHSGSPVRVLNKALTSNVATLTTDVAHGLDVGVSVFVSGVDATFDGTYVVKSKTLTTFTYDRIATNVQLGKRITTKLPTSTQTMRNRVPQHALVRFRPWFLRKRNFWQAPILHIQGQFRRTGFLKVLHRFFSMLLVLRVVQPQQSLVV